MSVEIAAIESGLETLVADIPNVVTAIEGAIAGAVTAATKVYESQVDGITRFTFTFQSVKKLGRAKYYIISALDTKTKETYVGEFHSVNGFKADTTMDQLQSWLTGSTTTTLSFDYTMGTKNPERLKSIKISSVSAATGETSTKSTSIKFTKKKSDPVSLLQQIVSELQDQLDTVKTSLAAAAPSSTTDDEGDDRDLELDIQLELIPVGQNWVIAEQDDGRLVIAHRVRGPVAFFSGDPSQRAFYHL